MASSRTTSFEPRRRQALPAEPREPSARSSRMSGGAARTLGVREKRIAARNRDDGGEGENARAESEILPERHAGDEVGGDEAREDAHTAVGEGEAEGGAGDYDDEAFRDELTNQAQRRRTERAADGDFAAAAFGANQEQAGDVDAGDDEQERCAAEENEEDGANVADDVFGERGDVGALVAVGVGIFVLELLRDGW